MWRLLLVSLLLTPSLLTATEPDNTYRQLLTAKLVEVEKRVKKAATFFDKKKVLITFQDFIKAENEKIDKGQIKLTTAEYHNVIGIMIVLEDHPVYRLDENNCEDYLGKIIYHFDPQHPGTPSLPYYIKTFYNFVSISCGKKPLE